MDSIARVLDTNVTPLALPAALTTASPFPAAPGSGHVLGSAGGGGSGGGAEAAAGRGQQGLAMAFDRERLQQCRWLPVPTAAGRVSGAGWRSGKGVAHRQGVLHSMS